MGFVYDSDGGLVLDSDGDPISDESPYVPVYTSGFNYTSLITSEHNQKPNFMDLVDLLANSAGQIVQVTQSMQTIFDLEEAIGAQQDVVGEWVGQSRTVGGILTVAYFGFADDEAALPFGELTDPSIGGEFFDLGDSTSSSSVLTDANYQLVLQAKVLANQYAGDLPTLENAFNTLTGADPILVDPGILVVTVIAGEPLNSVIQQLLSGFDILPRPAGTQYVHLYPYPYSSSVWEYTGNAYINGSEVGKL